MYTFTRASWKVHMMKSYLLLITFLTNVIQALQHRWNKCVDCKEDYVKKYTSFGHIHSMKVSWSADELFTDLYTIMLAPILKHGQFFCYLNPIISKLYSADVTTINNYSNLLKSFEYKISIAEKKRQFIFLRK